MTNATEALRAAPALERVVSHRPGGWIHDWRPEDTAFWEATGKRIARRNLVLSILSEHIGFCIWSMWSVIVLFLGPEYGISPSQKFLLTTVPTGVGAVLRIPYTLAVARFGGRNWTVVSALLLLIPTLYCAAILEPGVSFETLLFASALAGIGGGNFSSSMANIDAYYPMRLKGWALGLNAGGGNIGVAAVQLAGLAILATAGRDHPRLLLVIYVPLVVISAALAWRYMDNLATATNERHGLRDVLREPHTWSISLLYIGSFGSFIGFGFAFGQVLQVQFADTFDTPAKAAQLTFLGPLVGSLVRPFGGRLADRIGAARVTMATFVAMSVAAAIVLTASVRESLGLFLAGFLMIFALTGIGNGSIYKIIPVVFGSQAEAAIAAGEDEAAARGRARRLSGSLIGLAGAIGAFGGVLVNLALRQSFLSVGSGTGAYGAFIGLYVVCLCITWFVYLRPSRREVAA